MGIKNKLIVDKKYYM